MTETRKKTETRKNVSKSKDIREISPKCMRLFCCMCYDAGRFWKL